MVAFDLIVQPNLAWSLQHDASQSSIIYFESTCTVATADFSILSNKVRHWFPEFILKGTNLTNILHYDVGYTLALDNLVMYHCASDSSLSSWSIEHIR